MPGTKLRRRGGAALMVKITKRDNNKDRKQSRDPKTIRAAQNALAACKTLASGGLVDAAKNALNRPQ